MYIQDIFKINQILKNMAHHSADLVFPSTGECHDTLSSQRLRDRLKRDINRAGWAGQNYRSKLCCYPTLPPLEASEGYKDHSHVQQQTVATMC